jgi:serine/threonine protein kinase
VADDTLIGKRLGQYEILSALGHGGVSTVYRARQSDLDRMVAVKVLPREFLRDQTFLPRFEREARVLARMEHFHIVPIYDVGAAEGMPFLVMRYMPRGTLAAVLKRRGKLTPLDIVPIVQQVCSALDFAHQRGVIHRNLKPSNILFDNEGIAYVSDFGIGRVREATAAMTGISVVGNPAYLAPEIGRGDIELTPAVDIYSLGTILFETLTGQRPFADDTPVKLVMKHINEPIPSLRAANPEVDIGIEAIVTKMMAKRPEDRYGRASEVSTAFSKVVGVTASSVRHADITPHLQAAQSESTSDLPEDTPILPPSPLAPDLEPKAITSTGMAPQKKQSGPDRAEERKRKRELAIQQRAEDRKRRRQIRQARIAALLLIVVFFVLGAQIGLEARGVANHFKLGMINATQTLDASTLEAVVTMTADADSTATQAVEFEHQTATMIAILGTVTPTPTSTPTATPTSTPTPLAGAANNILLVSERDGDPEIFTLDLVTREMTQLTDNDAFDANPRWSPDGTLIAFQSNETPEGQHIYVVDADGKNLRELTRGIRVDRTPIWSPDGSVIAFYSADAGRGWLRQVTVEGDWEDDIVQVPAGTVRLLDWSPDGATITMYGFGRDSVLNILAVDVANGDRTPITDAIGDVQFVDYSPDRSMVVFTATDYAKRASGRIQLYLADTNCIDGILNRCNVRRITDDEDNWTTPRFSPDGELILVTSDRGGSEDLWLIDLEGYIIEQLTSSPFDEYDGSWQPLPR